MPKSVTHWLAPLYMTKPPMSIWLWLWDAMPPLSPTYSSSLPPQWFRIMATGVLPCPTYKRFSGFLRSLNVSADAHSITDGRKRTLYILLSLSPRCCMTLSLSHSPHSSDWLLRRDANQNMGKDKLRLTPQSE